jgi:hypothetical protein
MEEIAKINLLTIQPLKGYKLVHPATGNNIPYNGIIVWNNREDLESSLDSVSNFYNLPKEAMQITEILYIKCPHCFSNIELEN